MYFFLQMRAFLIFHHILIEIIKLDFLNKLKEKINRGNECALRKIIREFHKKENGVIVSGGISKDGLGKLIFHSGNVNSLTYKQALQFYRENIDKFPG